MRAHALVSSEMMIRKDPREELFDLIGVLARRRHQSGERGFARLGLNHTEARLLAMLAAEGGPATQEALSRRISVDRSNAGRAFKGLERAGYVSRRRDEADSRTNLVEITPEGTRAAAEVDRLRSELARAFLAGLSETEAATVVRLLRKGSAAGAER